MASILRPLLQATAFKSPLLRTIVPCAALAYGIQAAVAVPSIVAQDEKFYDLSGSLTYLSCTALSLYLPVLRAKYAGAAIEAGFSGILQRNWRQLAISACVGLWAGRLGTYLFRRISASGEDSRFSDIRTSPPKFAVAFFAQATWVTLCLMPVLALNSLPSSTFGLLAPVLATDILGFGLFLFGQSFEAGADWQKSTWLTGKREKKHSEEFMTKGFWSLCRYPNYFGEITLWTGIATAAAGVLTRDAAQKMLGLSGITGKAIVIAMCAVSPAFTTTLLTQVSGIPMSEGKYDKRYGDRKDYKEWKEKTPMLIPIVGP